ncbi:ABC transporter substrate-binding protein [Thermoproteota archaeon]
MKKSKYFSLTKLLMLYLMLSPGIGITQIFAAEDSVQKFIELPEEWGIEPKYGGTLICRIYREPKHFNPNYEYVPADESYQNVFNRLVRIDQISLEIVPDIALSWIISDDFKTYTFTLAEANWHDGEPFTSADVKWSYDDVLNRKGYYFEELDHIEEIETPDDRTVTFRLERADNAFLYTIAFNRGPVILPKHLYEGTDPLTNPYNLDPIGTGPFKFVRWIKGSHIEYEANLDYFKGRPYLDKIFNRYISSDSAYLLALKSGEVHVALASEPPFSALPDLEQDPNIDIGVIPASIILHVGFNLLREPYNDIRVRQAIAHAVDVETINDLAYLGFNHENPFAYGEVGFLPWSFNPNAKMPEYNIEEANRILDDAGYTRGSDGVRWTANLVVFTWAESAIVAEILKDSLAKIGIEVEIDVYEFTTYSEIVIQNRDYDLTIAGGTQGPDPDRMDAHFGTGGFRNSMNYSSPEVDALLTEGTAALTIEERKPKYWEIQEILIEDLPRVNFVVYMYPYPHNNEYQGFWYQTPYHSLSGGYSRLDLVWWEGGKDIPKPDDVIPEPPIDTEIEPRVKAVEDTINNVESKISSLTSQIESLKSQVESIETPPPASNAMAYVGILIALVAVALALYQRSQ